MILVLKNSNVSDEHLCNRVQYVNFPSIICISFTFYLDIKINVNY